MTDFICPFCGTLVSATSQTYRKEECYFNRQYVSYSNTEPVNADVFNIVMQHCPSCNKVSMIAKGAKNLYGVEIPLNPKSLAKQFPLYVPLAIREDYEEAYSIVKLSPKASATLSRRCLQGMIRDFWNISRSTLFEEITAIKSNITSSEWKAIDAVRSIGNIGAHMKKDVNEIVEIEEDEAESLLKLIELLVNKWYIARNDDEELLNTIVNIKESKNRTKTEVNNKEELPLG